jgi:hypothetical protein
MEHHGERELQPIDQDDVHAFRILCDAAYALPR